MAAEPVLRNSELGHYTNFVNLLGWSALAVPAAITPAGLPFGVTFVAPGGSDAALLRLGAAWQALLDLPLGARLAPATPADLVLAAMPRCEPTLALAVVGAHLEGQPLHGQLVERGARCIARTRTAPRYRLFALAHTTPPKPGLSRVGEGDGHAIDVEVYDMPTSLIGSFLAGCRRRWASARSSSKTGAGSRVSSASRCASAHTSARRPRAARPTHSDARRNDGQDQREQDLACQ